MKKRPQYDIIIKSAKLDAGVGSAGQIIRNDDDLIHFEISIPRSHLFRITK
jgi:hypothetical protein